MHGTIGMQACSIIKYLCLLTCYIHICKCCYQILKRQLILNSKLTNHVFSHKNIRRKISLMILPCLDETQPEGQRIFFKKMLILTLCIRHIPNLHPLCHNFSSFRLLYISIENDKQNYFHKFDSLRRDGNGIWQPIWQAPQPRSSIIRVGCKHWTERILYQAIYEKMY